MSSLFFNIDIKDEDKEKKTDYSKKVKAPFNNLFPLRAVVSGASGTGKSFIIKRLVFHYYKDALNAVFLFSGTSTTIEEYERAHEKMKPNFILKTFDKYSDDTVNELIETMKESRKPSIFIFEDLMYQNIMGKNKNNAIDRLYQTARHYNINVITTAQRYTQLNPSSRMNNSNLVLVFNANDKELDTLFNEHGNHLSRDDFKDAFKKAVNENYKFFCIDYTENDFNRRLKDADFNPICQDIKSDLKDELGNLKPRKSKNIDKDKDENNDNNEKKDIKLVGFKRDGNDMIAKFKVDGKQKEVRFNNNSKTKDENNPMDPGVLKENIIKQTGNLRDRIQKFKISFL